MYQFFNCLTGDPVKFIRRLKIVKKKDRKANLEKTRKNELTTNLNLLNEYAKQFSSENLEPNENKVKLISYSKNPKSVIDEIRECLVNEINLSVKNEAKTDVDDETKKVLKDEVKINLVDNFKDDNALEKIIEEEEDLKVYDEHFDEDLKSDSLDQKISDEILHVLHVNSIDCRTTNTLYNSDKKTENEKIIDDQKEMLVEKNNHFQNLNLKENFDSNKMTNISEDNLTTNKNNLNVLKLKDDENKLKKPSVKFNTDETTNDNLEDKTKFNKKFQDNSDLRTAPILAGVETWIELIKENESAIGINLISRFVNDEELFIVHELLNDGIAKNDKRLKIGDIILQVNDITLKNITLKEATSHLNRTSGSVKLLVYREFLCLSDINNSQLKDEQMNESKNIKNNSQDTQKNIVEQKVIDGRLYEIFQVDLQKKANKGLGLCIVNDFGNSPGPFISEILPNSTAFSEGSLKKGDHIISINGQDYTKESSNSTLTVLKCLSGTINLKIARLKPGQVINLDSMNSNQSIKSKRINFKVLTFNSNKSKKTTIKKHKQINRVVNKLKEIESYSDLSLLNETIDSKCLDHSISKNWIKIDRSKTNLRENIREDLQSIDSGLDEQFIDELEKNDQIIEVNGQTFAEKNKDELINKIKRLSSLVLMVVSI